MGERHRLLEKEVNLFPYLRRGVKRFKEEKRTQKINISKIAILILCIGVFFSIPISIFAFEESEETKLDYKDYDPLEKVLEDAKRVEKEIKTKQEEQKEDENYSYKLKQEENRMVVEIEPEIIDPLSKIDKLVVGVKVMSLKKIGENIQTEVREDVSRKMTYDSLLAEYPMSEMTSALSEQNEAVSSFLIAIAKKESNWGVHSPKKDGKECYNFWGYKGGYNSTESGYSCFDSAEQAVTVVGSRIEELINKNIDTPEKMIVWKCGSTCAGHDPGSVEKWIKDVGLYYQKLNS